MRFISVVRSTKDVGEPPHELFAAIGESSAALIADGRMVETGQLSHGARVALRAGEVSVQDGLPVEHPDGYAIFDVQSEAEAVKLAGDFLDLHRKYWPAWEGEVELHQVIAAEF